MGGSVDGRTYTINLKATPEAPAPVPLGSPSKESRGKGGFRKRPWSGLGLVLTLVLLALAAYGGVTMLLAQLKQQPKAVTGTTVAHTSSEPVHESRVHAFIAETGCTRNFFLAWTTAAESFSLRYRRTIESTLMFHPTACLIVYSPTLPHDHFQRFWDLGYNIIVERPNVPYLLDNTPAEVWYRNIEEWKKGPYFFSHITEIIRLASLYKYGGVYLDTDVIVMRDLSGLRNCLGTELAGSRGEAKILNGAVLAFDKGSPFIWEGMVEFNTTYRIDSWGWNGPELVTRVAGRFPRGPELRILPTIAFYPIHWAKVKRYFTLENMEDQHRVWQRMEAGTYLFHYWNKVTVQLIPEKGSLMYKVLNNYCLFCDETGKDG